MKYRTDIDILRALAVLLVILYHANIGVFTGGFVGVDVFFVISGFLTTYIVVNGIREEKFSLLSFYFSRLRRVFPALFVFTLIALLVSYLSLLYYGSMQLQARAARAALTGVSNVYFYNNTGYFDLSSHLHAFLHTWSLSVEMQFYLLFPLIVLACYRFFKIKIQNILLSLLFLSLLLSIYMLGQNESAVFYLLPFRVWEFMLGGYIALNKWSPQSQKTKCIFIFLGIALILLAAVTYGSIFLVPYPGQYALLPCIGAGLYLIGGNGLNQTAFIKKYFFSLFCFLQDEFLIRFICGIGLFFFYIEI